MHKIGRDRASKRAGDSVEYREPNAVSMMGREFRRARERANVDRGTTANSTLVPRGSILCYNCMLPICPRLLIYSFPLRPLRARARVRVRVQVRPVSFIFRAIVERRDRVAPSSRMRYDAPRIILSRVSTAHSCDPS